MNTFLKLNFIPVIIILLANNYALQAQQPSWIKPEFRKKSYPVSEYLIGFASEKNVSKQDENSLLIKLEAYAKSQLSESVIVSINSMSELTSTEEKGKFQDYFKKNCTSSTSMNIAGIKIENYYDKKESTAYVLVYVKKETLLELYKNTIDLKVKTLAQKIESAEKYASSNDNQNALKNYVECYPIFREIEEAQGIYLALKAQFTDENVLKIKETSDYKIKVDKGIKSLQKNANSTIDDACFFLVNELSLQTGKRNESVRLTNISYKDTKMGSEFSRKFSSVFEQKLISTGGYNITTEAVVPGTDGSGNKFIITGTYWEEVENIKVIAIMRNSELKAVASAEAYIPQAWFKNNNISFVPENFKEAYSNMKAFTKDEVKGGDLIVDVWTNKGNENIIYTKGDKMKLFVRANKECYLRFVYHLADGSKALLLDNYYISSDKVNMVYELPYEFECSEPFGIETLQLNAQTDQFQSLTVKKQDGYDFIQDNLTEVLVKTRGMKRVDNKVNMKAEKRIIVTTMNR